MAGVFSGREGAAARWAGDAMKKAAEPFGTAAFRIWWRIRELPGFLEIS